MKPRERVIVGIMVLAGLYAVYDLVFSGSAAVPVRNAEKELAELQQFVNDLIVKMPPDDPTPATGYVIGRLQRGLQWKQDPFNDEIFGELALSAARRERQEALAQVSFTYTGFASLGDRRLAIVNGSEYFEGETLAQTGYQLYRVLPGEIEVRAIDGEDQRVIPLKEEIETKVKAQ